MSRHLNSIFYIERQTGNVEKEEILGEGAIRFLYGSTLLSRTIGRLVLNGFAKWPPCSAIYGWLQKRARSKRKIIPFINHFQVDASEFEQSPEQFSSFNDFFIRKLKSECRPISHSPAVIPADGRYTFFTDLSSSTPFSVKNRTFCLKTILRDSTLATRYEGGSLVIARLCPTDCHRFYFPIDCVPGTTEEINGKLFSVNPIATKDNPWIWGANRRYLTILSSEHFGKVAFLEVGATNVGTVIQTYTPGKTYHKGEEKGYFSFGGSALLLFFERGKIEFSDDLLEASKRRLEIRCLIGQPLSSLS
ncbi:MAG: phosphatidylserine decarboxylase [Verrucomicrobia bacterium]|nr:phosphatidylserine decarboxylase [Verrucomicrobiota bacterium]